jgi:nucleotidyltransferase substrate binding protein (TIGR01987 family)
MEILIIAKSLSLFLSNELGVTKMPSNLVLGKIDISALLKAKAMLDIAISTAKSPLEIAGAIQCFEFSYELAWKTMRRILISKGIETQSPRDTFREAGLNKLIADPRPWFEFISKRNLTIHTYDSDLANEIFKFLPTFRSELNEFINNIQALSS